MIKSLNCWLWDLSTHSRELISNLDLIILILFLLQEFVEHLFTCPLIATELDLIKGNLIPYNLFDVIVESFFAYDAVFILDWTCVNNFSWFQRIYDIFKRILVFPQNLCETMAFFDIILKHSINLCSKAIALEVLWPINVPDIAIKLYLFLSTHLFEQIIHLLIFIKPVTDFERFEFVSDLRQLFHELVELFNIFLLLFVSYKRNRVIEQHRLSWQELSHTDREVSVFSRPG